MNHYIGYACIDIEVNVSRHVVAESYADAWRTWVKHCSVMEWTPTGLVEHD